MCMDMCSMCIILVDIVSTSRFSRLLAPAKAEALTLPTKYLNPLSRSRVSDEASSAGGSNVCILHSGFMCTCGRVAMPSQPSAAQVDSSTSVSHVSGYFSDGASPNYILSSTGIILPLLPAGGRWY
jgi:hypothetical protein